MTTWFAIRDAFSELSRACKSGASIDEQWDRFSRQVRESADSPPAHLDALIEFCTELADERGGRDLVRILDHGTGTGINILYLAALGFRAVWGCNVVDKAQPHNRVFREILETGEDRIVIYEGQTLPFADAMFDVVLSQQVVEHLPDAIIDGYYAEEGRVLIAGGRAFHQLPHRWLPYDGHTRTWFVSYLPRSMRNAIWRRIASNPSQIETYLFLRDRSDHFTRAERYIGKTSDSSGDILFSKAGLRDYEGPAAMALARRTAVHLADLPLIGSVFRAACRPLIMIETCSVKADDSLISSPHP